jgi:hypothetical protein
MQKPSAVASPRLQVRPIKPVATAVVFPLGLLIIVLKTRSTAKTEISLMAPLLLLFHSGCAPKVICEAAGFFRDRVALTVPETTVVVKAEALWR